VTETDLRTAGSFSDVSDEAQVASALQLSSYPNPVSLQTTFAYSLAQRSPVHLEVFDAQGRLVATLVNETQDPGRHRVAWDGCGEDGRSLPSGIYYGKLRSTGKEEVRRLLLVR
jgi:flagellar hook assembly protein FlgD